MLRSPLDILGSTLLPASCPLCGSPVPHLALAPVCDACWAELPAESGLVCSRCGDTLDCPSDPDPALTLCRACRLAEPPFVRAVAYGPYRAQMRQMVHALKYDGMRALARRLGQRLAQAIALLAPQAPADMLVIPVPLYRAKYGSRGFNQSELLAASALRALRRSHPAWRLTLAPGLLRRTRLTATQAGLTPRQRRLNLRRAFAVVRPEAVQQRSILVIDDIFTTGATARAAARALADAGAASVWVATLARARRLGAQEALSLNPPNPLSGAAPAHPHAYMHAVPEQPSRSREDTGCRWEKP